MNKRRKNLGFTLIELLVVISIISFMSSIVLSAVTAARIKARDARRLADVKELQKALAIYYSAFGYYPVASSVSSNNPNWSTSANGLYVGLVPGYISQLPTDPLPNDSTYNYIYRGSASSIYTCNGTHKYVIYFMTEQRNALNNSDAFGSSVDRSAAYYCLYGD